VTLHVEGGKKNGMRKLLIAGMFYGTMLGQLSDTGIQSAFDVGHKTNVKDLWKSIEKTRTVKINGARIGGDTVAKRAVFLTPIDAIALADSALYPQSGILGLSGCGGAARA
jgi:hypothetical protein